jgi:hypothetical protein
MTRQTDTHLPGRVILAVRASITPAVAAAVVSRGARRRDGVRSQRGGQEQRDRGRRDHGELTAFSQKLATIRVSFALESVKFRHVDPIPS